MEINLDEKYDNKKIKSKNNIFFIYGQNTFGKTNFLNYFKLLLKKRGNNVFSDLNFDNDRNFVEINEEWDLKKELSLAKTSPIRKFILNDLMEMLEKENIDLYNEIENNENLKLIKERINKIIQVEEKEYFVKCDYSFNTASDLIDNLYKLKILNKNDDEVNESIIPKSIKSQLFMKLLIEANSKNKIIIFDCPETYFDKNYQIIFSNMLSELAKENIIIVTYRNPYFLMNSKIEFSNLYFFNSDKKINEFKVSKTILIKLYLLMNKNFESFKLRSLSEFESKIKEIEFVIEKEDIIKIKNNIFKIYLPVLLSNIDFNLNYLDVNELHLLSENEKMIFIILSMFNDIKIKDIDKISFKNNLLNEILELI